MFFPRQPSRKRRPPSRKLNLERLEHRLPLADLDDSLTEAISLGAISTTAVTRSDSISPSDDVDMYRFTVAAGQTVDFDIDTPINGPGGLGSFIRIFNSLGNEIAFNNDAAAPGENFVGFDAYRRFTFASAGTFYIGVSNANNTLYNANTGDGDVSTGTNAVGEYQLIVQALPIDTDDTLTEATNLGTITSTPSVVNAAISPDIDVDIYRFTAAAGQSIDFDIDTPLNGPGGLGSFIRIFNAQGQEIAFNDDAAAPGESPIGFDSYLRFTFGTAGTYYVGVSNNTNTLYNTANGGNDEAGGQNSIGNYQLIVQTAPVVVADPDDTLAEATPLGAITTTPDIVDAAISPDIDVDLYAFTVTAGQTVDFDIDTPFNGPGSVGSFLRLFNAQGQEIAFNDDARAPGENVLGFDAYLRFTFGIAGTFYIGVSNLNNTLYNPVTGTGDVSGGLNATGSYQLIVQAMPVDLDDAISETTSLGLISATPVAVNGSINPDVDVDLYAFTVTAGQVVDFDIDTPFNGPGGLGSFLRVFNAQGQELAFNDDGTAPGESVLGFDAFVRFTFATAGTYYVGVSNNSNTLYNANTGNGDSGGGLNATGSYQLLVQTATPVVADPDDTLTEATSLGAITTTPSTATGSISPDVDVDMYSFTVTAGQVVDFDIDTAFNGPGGLGSFLRLFNSLGQELAFNDDGVAPGETTFGFDAYLRFTFTTAGTYYIGVSNNSNTLYNATSGAGDASGGQNTTGTYQLSVQSAPAVVADPDDTLIEATSLGAISTAASVVNGAILPDTDVDIYDFTATAGQVIDFDIDTAFNGPGGLGSFLRLFNNQGQQLASNDNAAAPGESQLGFDAYFRFTFTAAGTYYIGVSNNNNTLYSPLTGAGDLSGGANATGDYQLRLQAVPVVNPTLSLSANLSSIPERGGTAIGTVTRNSTDLTQALIVTLSSSDNTSATVPSSVVIPANQTSAAFTISGVPDINRGTRSVTVTATATGHVAAATTLQITDSDGTWQNKDQPTDVDDSGVVAPFDAILVINYLNNFGGGPVPVGSPPPFLDVDGNNVIAPIDAILVINELNSRVPQLANSPTAVPQAALGESVDAALIALLAADSFTVETRPKLRRRTVFD